MRRLGGRAGLSLSAAELDRLRTLLASAAGLVFEDSRRDSLALSVAERLTASCAPSVAAWLDRVAADPDERQLLLDEVTVQETSFFRNPPQVRALREQVLPELLRAAATKGRPLRIWSAGCSTGEEPYTIAMLLLELLPGYPGLDVQVLATDLSQAALAAARRATYGSRALHLASPAERARFFTAVGRGRFEVTSEVRDLVRLQHHNLVREPAVASGLDLVLCRNVTIYFSRDTTRQLVGRLHGCLRDGGYLFLGHSETLWQLSDQFRLVTLGSGPGAAYVYRRDDGSPAVSPAVRPANRLKLPAPRQAPTRVVESAQSARRRRPVARQVACGPVVAVLPDPALELRQALAEGRYAEAAAGAALAAIRQPLRAELHYLRGLALVDLGHDGEALPALRRAVYLAPSDGLSHFLLAGALDRVGDAAAAAREFRAAALTLDAVASDAPELGGRSPRELAVLCAELSARTWS